MTKVILYLAASSDGFIADKQAGVAWLDEYNNGTEDCGFYDFYDSIDALAIGNNTYKQILTFGSWPYPGKKSYIFSCSNTLIDKDKTISDNIELGFFDVPIFMKKIILQNIQQLWLVGGAELADSFYKFGYIDEFIVTVLPKKLEEGITLPPPLSEKKILNY